MCKAYRNIVRYCPFNFDFSIMGGGVTMVKRGRSKYYAFCILCSNAEVSTVIGSCDQYTQPGRIVSN